MPSNPAISIAANAKYAFAEGSGQRNSTRFAFGESEYIGMRAAAERLRWDMARLTGASYPGTSRLYELVVGAQNAIKAGACLSSPPMYQRHDCEVPAQPLASWKRLFWSFHRLWWQCMPLALS